MDRTKRLLLLMKQKTEQTLRRHILRKRDEFRKSLLRTLPPEVLQMVANFLPAASAASLTLSCRRVYFILGTQYLENLIYDHYERPAFLKLLERDLQGHIICETCIKLHKIKDAKHYTLQAHEPRYLSPGGMFDKCSSKDIRARVPSYIFANFSTTVFKMTMKHYSHFGVDAQCRRLLKILSEGPSEVWHSCRHISLQIEQAECLIQHGSLFARNVVYFDIIRANPRTHSIDFEICPHLDLYSEEKFRGLRVVSSADRSLEKRWSLSLLGNKSLKTLGNSWDLCSELSQCWYCRTEYQVEVTHIDTWALKCTITIWKNLGQGPDTKTWRDHLPRGSMRQFGSEVVFQRGEVASVFKK